MNSVSSRILFASLVGGLPAANLSAPALLAAEAEPARATEVREATAVVARARAFLGEDATLDAVTSLRYAGTVHAEDGRTHQIEIVVRRPLQQRVIETLATSRVTTVLSDYDGWRREERLDKSGATRVALLNAPEVRRMRANTWQNIYFYKDLDAVGGTVTVAGEEVIDGITCVKTVFEHTGGVRFQRFFDKQTGRLVVTRTDDGMESRESGEMFVAGIRFPKELSTSLNAKTSKVVFDEVAVNEPVADELFETPMPKFNFPAPVAEEPATPEEPTAPAPGSESAPESPSPPVATEPTPESGPSAADAPPAVAPVP